MTEHKLNKRIAEALNIFHSDDCFGRVRVWDSGMRLDGEPRGYCNNWNDLMPLVIEYGILESPTFIRHVIEHDSGEPQLALAECLLKVLENKK